MITEKQYKREDGSKVRLSVSICIDFRDVYRNIDVMVCPAGKRTFYNVHSTDDYSWRKLNTEDRKKAILEKQLKYVSANEINEVCRELTEQIYAKISITPPSGGINNKPENLT